MKIAIVHEWLVDHSGSEKVLEEMLNVFPDADLFAVVEFLPKKLKFFIKNKQVKTTFIQKLPFARKYYRNYLPLMPFAIEQLDVSKYDLIISNSHAVAKGVITHSDQLHICYCHSPIRYAWDLYHEYLREAGLDKGIKGLVAKFFLHYLRQWDLATSNRIDYFIANSKYIAKRISKVYKRKAEVIYPPVNVTDFSLIEDKEEYYLTASRMVSYKRLDIIVQSFVTLPEKKLLVIGDGPEFEKIKKIAPPNVELLGFQPFEILKEKMQKAKAFIFAANEDFGIIPVEAQACGTPVIFFSKGGAKETVLPYKSGIPFFEQTPLAILKAIKEFELSEKFEAKKIRQQAIKFSRENFRNTFEHFISQKVKESV